MWKVGKNKYDLKLFRQIRDMAGLTVLHVISYQWYKQQNRARASLSTNSQVHSQAHCAEGSLAEQFYSSNTFVPDHLFEITGDWPTNSVLRVLFIKIALKKKKKKPKFQSSKCQEIPNQVVIFILFH